MKSNFTFKTPVLALAGTLCLPVAMQAASKSSKKNKKPNIIYIMSDDHTSQAIGAYNSRLAKLNPTPTIDKLAAEGVVFDRVYCNNSISTPSRASIMTGQYSHVNGVLTLDEKLKPEQQHLAREMKKLGYQTAMVGKWHLGCEPSAFDYYSVFTQAGEQGMYFDPLMANSDNTKKKFPFNTIQYKGHSSDIVTDVTLNWLKEKRNEDQPFFIMHHYKAPHDHFQFAPRYASYLEDVDIPIPETLLDRKGFGSIGTRGQDNSLDRLFGTSVSSRNVHRNYVEMYDINEGNDQANTVAAYNEYLKRYLRCVKGVDDNLERLFNYLKENDLWDNTVIVYTGDQGMMLGEHDLQDKRWMYEECFRMPFIMKVPKAKLKDGVHSDLLIQNVDFAPTLLALAGAEKTPAYMQGEDFSPIFNKEELPNWRDAVYYRYWMHMIHHNVPAHFGIRTKDYKLIFFYGRHYDPTRYGEKTLAWIKDCTAFVAPTPVSFELYDLSKDPQEKTNVANDPQYAEVLKQMKKRLIEQKYKLGDLDANTPEIRTLVEQNFK